MEHAKAVIELKKHYQLHMQDVDTVERLKSHENVLQVVDTTLLKCYLQVCYHIARVKISCIQNKGKI